MEKKSIFFSLFFLLFVVCCLLFVDPVHAQGLSTNIAKEVTALNFFQQELGVFVTRIVEVAMIGGAILLLIMLVWGAIDWIGSEGNPEKYEAAKKKITHALLGMAILACVWALWTLANYFLGIDKVFTGGGGGAGSGGAATGTYGEWWPFESKAEWEKAFADQHGDRAPTAADEAAFHESQPYAWEEQRPLTDEDWEFYYKHGHWP